MSASNPTLPPSSLALFCSLLLALAACGSDTEAGGDPINVVEDDATSSEGDDAQDDADPGDEDCTGESCQSESVCGNGTMEGDESCDGTDFGGITCADLGFESGNLDCNDRCVILVDSCVSSSAVCGDGMLNGAEEECDGTDLGGATCADFGYDAGTLGCSDDCSLVVTSCESVAGTCGDGVVGPGEACDGSDLNGQTCEGLGYYPGDLKCNDECRVDPNGCGGFCGDAVVNGFEVCDDGGAGTSCTVDCSERLAPTLHWIVQIISVSTGDASCATNAPGPDIFGVALEDVSGQVLGWGKIVWEDVQFANNAYVSTAHINGESFVQTGSICPPFDEETVVSLGCGVEDYIAVEFLDSAGQPVPLDATAGQVLHVFEWGSQCAMNEPQDEYDVFICTDPAGVTTGNVSSCTLALSVGAEGESFADIAGF